MKEKILKICLIVFVLSIITAAVVVFLRSIPFFDIKEVEVIIDGPVDSSNGAVSRLTNKLKGQNLLSVNLSEIKKSFKNLEGVSSVTVRRYWPSKLIVDLKFISYRIKFYTEDEGVFFYYLADEDTIERVNNETFSSYDCLCAVYLNPSYCRILEKWGPDEGFIQMVNLVGSIDFNLISHIQYTNNNVNGFGRLDIKLSGHDVTISVREPVTAEILLRSLEIIKQEVSPFDKDVLYDLYRLALVRRTGE